MHILYVNGHPSADSFHAAIQEAFLDSVASGQEVRVLELGKESFDPVLRFGYAKRMAPDDFITKSQQWVHWADHIVFAFPIWWGDAPALMKGWIERVFTPGEMYILRDIKNGRLLQGKTADLIVTSRIPRVAYYAAGNGALAVFTRNLFLLTGIKKRRVITLGSIGLFPGIDTAKRRKKFLAKVTRLAASIK